MVTEYATFFDLLHLLVDIGQKVIEISFFFFFFVMVLFLQYKF